MKYGNGNDEKLRWEILPDGVHIPKSEDDMQWPEELMLKKELNLDYSKGLDQAFFEDFFPCVNGHGKRLNGFHNDVR